MSMWPGLRDRARASTASFTTPSNIRTPPAMKGFWNDLHRLFLFRAPSSERMLYSLFPMITRLRFCKNHWRQLHRHPHVPTYAGIVGNPDPAHSVVGDCRHLSSTSCPVLVVPVVLKAIFSSISLYLSELLNTWGIGSWSLSLMSVEAKGS